MQHLHSGGQDFFPLCTCRESCSIVNVRLLPLMHICLLAFRKFKSNLCVIFYTLLCGKSMFHVLTLFFFEMLQKPGSSPVGNSERLSLQDPGSRMGQFRIQNPFGVGSPVSRLSSSSCAALVIWGSGPSCKSQPEGNILVSCFQDPVVEYQSDLTMESKMAERQGWLGLLFHVKSCLII